MGVLEHPDDTQSARVEDMLTGRRLKRDKSGRPQAGQLGIVRQEVFFVSWVGEAGVVYMLPLRHDRNGKLRHLNFAYQGGAEGFASCCYPTQSGRSWLTKAAMARVRRLIRNA